MKPKATSEINTEELLSGIFDIGPSKLSLGLYPKRSFMLSDKSLGPDPGGSAPMDPIIEIEAIIRKGNIAAVKALAGSPDFLPPKYPPIAAVIDPGIINLSLIHI